MDDAEVTARQIALETAQKVAGGKKSMKRIVKDAELGRQFLMDEETKDGDGS